jgi:hypothetical protein
MAGQDQGCASERDRSPGRVHRLEHGDEACEGVSSGVTAVINCPADPVHGKLECRRGGDESWEHRVVYTYNRDGLATAWNYRGSSGQRSSLGSQVLPSIQEAKLGDNLSQGTTAIQTAPLKTTSQRMK